MTGPRIGISFAAVTFLCVVLAGAVASTSIRMTTAARARALSLAVALVVGAVMNAGRARQLAFPLLALGAIPFALTDDSAESAQIELFRARAG